MTDNLKDVVAELAARNTRGFRASYVAEETGRPLGDIQRELVEMVDDGELTLEFHLRCPDDGAVLQRFKQGDELPIGVEIVSGDCEPFVAQKRDFWVAYVPTRELLSKLLHEARSGKAPARPRGLRRRAAAAMGIDSIRHRSGGSSTST